VRHPSLVHVLAVAMLLVAACSSPGDETAASPGVSTTSTGAPVQSTVPVAAASTTTTTTTPPVTLPSGVVWQGAVVDETPAAAATSLIATSDGFVATGFRGNPEVNNSLGQTARPMVYRSQDGTTWQAVELPAAGDRNFAADVAHGRAGYVAVGTVGTGCRFACPHGHSVAWVSGDGISWELVEPATFRGSVQISVTDVEYIAGTYVAVGRDERGGNHWVVGVWTSSDGRSWERVASLESDYSLLNDALHVVGDRLFIAADEAVCSKPFTNGDIGWVLGVWATQTRLWSSTNGAVWEAVDMEAHGLADPLPEDICEDDAYLDGDIDDLSAGGLLALGESLWWRRQDGAAARWSGTTWSPFTPPGEIEGLSLLPGPGGYIGLAIDGLRTGVIEVTTMTSSDASTWDDWTAYTRRIVDLLPAGVVAGAPVGATAVRHSAVQGDMVVMIVSAYTDDPTTTPPGVYALLSTPDVAAGPCEVGVDADCRGSDLIAADLAGADLAGIDLTGANLARANLNGADLTGSALRGADLDGADLSGAAMTRADLTGADLDFSTLVGSDLSGADMSRASLMAAAIDDTTVLTGANLTGALYVPLDLAIRHDVVLTGAEFDDWDGNALDLNGARLAAAHLNGDVTRFSFAGADLSGADLYRVTAIDADFSDADLTGARLDGADLTGADLAGAHLDAATWYGVTCPDGFELGYDTDVTCDGHSLEQ